MFNVDVFLTETPPLRSQWRRVGSGEKKQKNVEFWWKCHPYPTSFERDKRTLTFETHDFGPFKVRLVLLTWQDYPVTEEKDRTVRSFPCETVKL